ncbi:MAG: response regulator [Bryobacterales bacterium]|nr:response regulator [Bryobacteraceae bacterium]MDW8354639.1 response regulator [Bryobacterales bacterium]
MQKQANKKILAGVTDLFFTVKISDAAKRAGMQVEFVKSDQELLEKAHSKPAVIILDLNLESVHPLKTISKLKSDPELKKISVIGFISHLQAELKQKAQESGCDMVLARSAFSQNLPQILKRHSGTL